jgi:hypothetical protein
MFLEFENRSLLNHYLLLCGGNVFIWETSEQLSAKLMTYV